ncbi:MAG: L-threonine ammonia-lyase [Caulobacteraceae bacterium]|nr:L-threonine ammonia-lyase [Caulobacteraceae bacterium]
MKLPTFDDVLGAASRLEGLAVETPLVRHDVLDAAVGGKVFIKAECLQRTGSFKFRGAYNRISRLTADELTRGVTAFSSGNHAQGVAAAAGLLRTPAVIVMPADAPAAKIEGTKALGGEVVLYDRWTQSREAIAAEIAAERGAVVVPAFEDFYVIAGQGTAGLEAARQLEALGESADLLLAPASGGGLIGGIGLAFGALSPWTNLYAVEPEGYDDHAKSLAAGHPVSIKPQAASLLDALMAPAPGEMTFALNKPRLSGALAVSDEEALAAMAFAFRHLKLVLEPGGAAALAAVLAGKADTQGRTTLVIASGGNVDAAVYTRAIG